MDPALAWLLDPSDPVGPADPTSRQLAAADPGVRAKALVDLGGRSPLDPDVVDARERSRKEGTVARLLEGLTFPTDGNALYLPKYQTSWHRVIALGEMGAPADDPRLARALDLIFAFYPKPDGGMGRRGSHLCTTGNLCRAAILLGRGDDPRVARGIEWLVAQQMPDGGWHCWPEGDANGTIDAWEAMAAFAALPESARPRESVRRGLDFLFSHHLGIGGGYAPHERIHFPRHYYYDALVGLDIATAISPTDARLAPAIRWLERKRGADGLWRLDKHHPDFDDPDYTPYGPGIDLPIVPLVVEETGSPSKWATLYALRVLRRAGRGA